MFLGLFALEFDKKYAIVVLVFDRLQTNRFELQVVVLFMIVSLSVCTVQMFNYNINSKWLGQEICYCFFVLFLFMCEWFMKSLWQTWAGVDCEDRFVSILVNDQCK